MQEAFRENHGLQCGYCTPGMIMTAVDIVRRKGHQLEDRVIREELEGNICRCTGYHNIVKAIAAGARAMGETGAAEAVHAAEVDDDGNLRSVRPQVAEKGVVGTAALFHPDRLRQNRRFRVAARELRFPFGRRESFRSLDRNVAARTPNRHAGPGLLLRVRGERDSGRDESEEDDSKGAGSF
jgi:hypothetical protein